MRKKIIALVVCTLLIPGCTQVSYDTSDSDDKNKVITVLYGQSTSDPGMEDMLQEKIKDEFDIELEWESVDWGEYFSSEMQARIAAGEVPDIIIGKSQDVTGFYSSGFLGKFDSSFKQYINDEVLDSVTVDRDLYGIPYNALYQGVLYNKNIFKRYNLEVPTTIEELEQVVDRLQQVGVTPFASHYKESWYSANVLMQFATNEVFPSSPDWGTQFRLYNINFSNSEEYIFCFDNVKYVLENSWDDALSTLQDVSDKRFAEEEAAMYVSGTWSVQTISAISPSMNLGIFPYPNSSGDAELLFEPNVTFMINGYSENKELAEDIILSLVEDHELAETISLFTHTESLIKGVETDSLSMVKEDIESYRAEGRVRDVSIGNSQIVWSFQEELSEQMYSWFDGDATLEEVLEYADKHRSSSGNYSGG